MSPLRILILIILFYIAYRLLFGAKKNASRTNLSSNEGETATDILEEDPVCNKLVPRKQAVQYTKQGVTHYFCSKKCCRIFKNTQGDKK